MEAEAASLATETPTIGEITIACALGYLDLRFAHQDWRSGRANLAAWYQIIAQRPSLLATQP
jgi:glutathione S-transferase